MYEIVGNLMCQCEIPRQMVSAVEGEGAKNTNHEIKALV